MVFKINYATAEEMERQIPSIGPKKAAALVQIREIKGHLDRTLFEIVLGHVAGNDILRLVSFDRIESKPADERGACADQSSDDVGGEEQGVHTDSSCTDPNYPGSFEEWLNKMTSEDLPPTTEQLYKMSLEDWPKAPVKTDVGKRSIPGFCPEDEGQSSSTSVKKSNRDIWAAHAKTLWANMQSSSQKSRYPEVPVGKTFCQEDQGHSSTASAGSGVRKLRSVVRRVKLEVPQENYEYPDVPVGRTFCPEDRDRSSSSSTERVKRGFHSKSASRRGKTTDRKSKHQSSPSSRSRKNDEITRFRSEENQEPDDRWRVRRRTSSDSDSESESRSRSRAHHQDSSRRSKSRSGSRNRKLKSSRHKHHRRQRDSSASVSPSDRHRRNHSRARSASRNRRDRKDSKWSKASRRHHRSSSSSESEHHSHLSARKQRSGSAYYYASSDSSSDGERHDSRNHRRGIPNRIPKNLRYDGTSNWLSFKQKFESYQAVLNWSDEECRDYLGWSLEGRALDFFTITTRMGSHYSFRSIMKKLEKRFGAKELPETSNARFYQALQRPDESLNEWADRVLTLATPAFRDLPDKYCRQEAISKFCKGCMDKEAGKYACLEHPRSMEEAMDRIKHFQYISQEVDGKKRKSRDDGIVVNAMGSLTEADVKQMIERALSSIASNTGQNKAGDEGALKSGQSCFFCKQNGHFKKDCERYKSWLKRKAMKTPQESQGLNEQGSGETVEPLSRKK